MNKKDIVDAWAWIRKNNQSIPDDVLDLMKDAAIEKLASHTEVKGVDWEILKGGFNPDITHKWEESCHNVGCDIWSVRRISDDTIWAVGDDCFHGPIVRFNLRDNQITADFEYGDVGCSVLLSELSKPLQRTPLFKTEDGVDVFSNTCLWIVFSTFETKYGIVCADGRQQVGQFLYKPENNKYFMSEDKAKEYVLLNRPFLSVSNVLSLTGNGFFVSEFLKPQLIELVKQRLDKQ